MFQQIFLKRLDEAATGEAIMRPIRESGAWVSIAEKSINGIFQYTQGSPYFIQFVCRELYDVWTQAEAGEELTAVPWGGITSKLDADFFAGRWAHVTDRQRELMWIIAQLENCESEFTVQAIVKASQSIPPKPFSGSQVSTMLSALAQTGLVYRNRWGKYSLTVPLLDQFIRRQMGSLDAL